MAEPMNEGSPATEGHRDEEAAEPCMPRKALGQGVEAQRTQEFKN